MASVMSTDPTATDIISEEFATELNELLKEVASELDLHYEDEDFFALGPTIDAMKRIAERLEAQGYRPHETYLHILRRYNRHHQ